ncbi:MAG: division/cell wall cluster transcriptional repressor MraZ [Thermoleophilia bacterium]|nr:division/cell wall cluster transcriptional repressor MraZ [Thermoleophilia bacterium]
MAFRGQHEHSLDSKDRLTVPSKFREGLAEGVVLSKGPDACLWMMTDQAFQEIEDDYIKTHSPFGATARDLRRVFNSSAEEGELDSAGRVRIPKNLIKDAGLEGECAVIGAGDYVEIWNAEAWKKEDERLKGSFAEIAEGLSGAPE